MLATTCYRILLIIKKGIILIEQNQKAANKEEQTTEIREDTHNDHEYLYFEEIITPKWEMNLLRQVPPELVFTNGNNYFRYPKAEWVDINEAYSRNDSHEKLSGFQPVTPDTVQRIRNEKPIHKLTSVYSRNESSESTSPVTPDTVKKAKKKNPKFTETGEILTIEADIHQPTNPQENIQQIPEKKKGITDYIPVKYLPKISDKKKPEDEIAFAVSPAEYFNI